MNFKYILIFSLSSVSMNSLALPVFLIPVAAKLAAAGAAAASAVTTAGTATLAAASAAGTAASATATAAGAALTAKATAIGATVTAKAMAASAAAEAYAVAHPVIAGGATAIGGAIGNVYLNRAAEGAVGYVDKAQESVKSLFMGKKEESEKKQA